MITVRDNLLKQIEIFNEIFSEFLTSNNYFETTIMLDRLKGVKEEFPANPFIESIWENSDLKLSFRVRVYLNYMVFFQIINFKGESIDFNDFVKQEKINIVEMYYFEGNINEKFHQYLMQVLSIINSSILVEVIKGEKWVSVPFDWQNQK